LFACNERWGIYAGYNPVGASYSSSLEVIFDFEITASLVDLGKIYTAIHIESSSTGRLD